MARSFRLTLLPVAILSFTFCLISTADAGLVTFSNITQSGQSPGDPAMPFGDSSVAGNTLTFSGPDTFSASSIGGSFNFDNFTDGFLSFTVSAADDLTWITEFSLFEEGAVTFQDPLGMGTTLPIPLTGASVTALAGIMITELDHGDTPVDLTTAATIDDLSFALSFDLNDPSGLWQAFESVDFEAILADRGISYEYGVTEFNFFLNNQLFAFSEAFGSEERDGGTLAFIDKKNVVFSATTQMVPEPSTILLFGVTISMTCVRRKRS